MLNIMPINSLNEVADLRRHYLSSIGGRPEPFLEELIRYSGNIYRMATDNESIGYFCVSAKKTLLQFYVLDAYLSHAHTILSDISAQGYADKALLLTRDRLALSLALEFHKGVTVDCYVFEQGPAVPDILIDFDDLEFRQAALTDAPAIRRACGDFHDFLHYTLEGSIKAGEIYVLYTGETVLGTGVIAKPFHYPYVDIGMCVNEAYRRRSIGGFIVLQLIKECEKLGLVPGASCKYHNVGSRKTLEKAGLISKDRILRVTF